METMFTNFVGIDVSKSKFDLALIKALDWLAAQGVPVINISLSGPRNPAVAGAIARITKRGHVIVAAAGNDGPAAPPVFPGAYDNVVGVTAVVKHVGDALPAPALDREAELTSTQAGLASFARRFMDSINARKFTSFLRETSWDVIVSTHFLPSQLIADLKRKKKIFAPLSLAMDI